MTDLPDCIERVYSDAAVKLIYAQRRNDTAGIADWRKLCELLEQQYPTVIAELAERVTKRDKCK